MRMSACWNSPSLTLRRLDPCTMTDFTTKHDRWKMNWRPRCFDISRSDYAHRSISVFLTCSFHEIRHI